MLRRHSSSRHEVHVAARTFLKIAEILPRPISEWRHLLIDNIEHLAELDIHGFQGGCYTPISWIMLRFGE